MPYAICHTTILVNYIQCVELMAAIVGLYIMDAKARGPFSNESIAHIITKILDKPVSVSI
jgi:hypothetical protein